MEFDSAYFSHVPLLAAAVLNTTGPVLELGAGLGSTLMLHGLCGAMNRKLVTLETDSDWLGKFTNMERSWHTLRQVESFQELAEYSQSWGLAFIDHGIAEQRGESLAALSHVPVIVCHDTCYFWLYGYEPSLTEFKYRWDYKGNGGPMTTVVSNSINVANLLAEARL
jgi:hypothetical protein